MRISLIIILVVMAAGAIFPSNARADQRITVRVVGNLNLTEADRETFRTELNARLLAFATDVQTQAALGRPLVAFDVTMGDEPPEGAAAASAGKNNTIVLMFGELLQGRDNVMRPQARIYLGRSPARAALRYQHNLFIDVRARVSRGGSRQAEELDLYELLIGYALLRREWLRQSQLVNPVASVLDRRIDAAFGHGSVGSSPCLDWLRSGVREIRYGNPHPDPNAREPEDSQFSCT